MQLIKITQFIKILQIMAFSISNESCCTIDVNEYLIVPSNNSTIIENK